MYYFLGDKMNTLLYKQAESIIDYTLPSISNISNLIALLFHELEHINWLGLYICDEKNKQCTLGPFQGKIACTRIPYGKGVVGTCAKTRNIQKVDDVNKFKGHIACDCQSKSELCIPIKKDDTLYAILDIDSDIFNRFSNEDKETLFQISKLFIQLFSSDTQ